MRIAILDYGMGNLRSAQMALEHVGASTELTSDHERVRAADGVVLPGVGAFPKAMEAVRERGLDDLIRERLGAEVPVLGICLGMQLLFDSSEEMGGAEGIGLLPGRVQALPAPGLKVPQIGWNGVTWSEGTPLADGLPNPAAMYHVHSFAPVVGDDEVVIGRAEYGEPFVSAVGRGLLFGVQFHPEKSGPHGLALLRNFTRLCEDGALRAAA